MTGDQEQKVKISAALNPRVVGLIEAEKKRLGISWGEMLRRITDDWADRLLAARMPAKREVFVMDQQGEVHRAR